MSPAESNLRTDRAEVHSGAAPLNVREIPGLAELCLTTNGSRLEELAAPLRQAGVGLLYHALRLGEGRDTPFDPRERRRSLHRIHAEGLGPAHLVEPVGSEHTDEEIADVLLAG